MKQTGEGKSMTNTCAAFFLILTMVGLFLQLSLWAGTSRPIIWNKNLRSLCVSAGWMYKLSVVYLYFFNGQLIIQMILYFVWKVNSVFFLNICCSFLMCNTQLGHMLSIPQSLDVRHFIFRDTSKFNHFFCLYIFAGF